MKRKKLVIAEMFFNILIVIGVFFLIFNIYFIFKGIGKDVLYVNDKNRQIIEKMVEKSENYNNSKEFENVKKIQFFLAFNDLEFTIYYRDGATQIICDDDLTDLEQYIEKNGYNKGEIYSVFGIVTIGMCIMINEMRKKVSKQIDLIDKVEE